MPLRYLGFALSSLFGFFILLTAISYLTPDFTRGFLFGREKYFFGLYQGALLFHGVSASVAILIAGYLMVAKKGSSLHRFLGKFYVSLVLFLAAPTGFYLSFYAIGGWISTLAFVLLSLCWWFTTWMAIRSTEHGYWIRLSYLLACSAFFLRGLILLGISLNMERIVWYQGVAWMSWLPGMLLYFLFAKKRKSVPAEIKSF